MLASIRDKHWWLSAGLPWLLTLAMVIVVAWQLAGLTLGLMNPPHAEQGQAQQTTTSGQASSAVSVNWQSLQVFGREVAGQQAKPATVKKTTQESSVILKRLGIKLIGVVASSNEENSYIAVQDKGNVEIYRTGDEIRDDVTVDEIRPKEIVLGHAGEQEVISLVETNPDAGAATQSQARPSARSINTQQAAASKTFRVTNEKVLQRIDTYRDTLKNDPVSLLGKVRTTQVMKDGKVYGQRLRSGSDRMLLPNIGLRSGDILLSVNGYPTTDANKLPELIEAMATSSTLQLMIERGGQQQELSVVLGQ